MCGQHSSPVDGFSFEHKKKSKIQLTYPDCETTRIQSCFSWKTLLHILQIKSVHLLMKTEKPENLLELQNMMFNSTITPGTHLLKLDFAILSLSFFFLLSIFHLSIHVFFVSLFFCLSHSAPASDVKNGSSTPPPTPVKPVMMVLSNTQYTQNLH